LLSTGLLAIIALVLMCQLSASLVIWAALVTPGAIVVFVVTRTRLEQRFTNPGAIAAMADHAQETFVGERGQSVCAGILRDRDVPGMMAWPMMALGCHPVTGASRPGRSNSWISSTTT
jgi:hypothetical protein